MLKSLAPGEPSIDVKSSVADAVLAAQILRSDSGLVFSQNGNDLFFSESTAPHGPSPMDEPNLSLAGSTGSRSAEVDFTAVEFNLALEIHLTHDLEKMAAPPTKKSDTAKAGNSIKRKTVSPDSYISTDQHGIIKIYSVTLTTTQ